MSNMTGPFSEKTTRRAWTNEPFLARPLANFAIPASTPITFYDGQAMGRDASGNLVQMDDTLKAEFVGFETDVIASALTVLSTDSLGDKYGHVHRPYAFVSLIASAAAGDEGKKVWWLYNNQVAYSGLSNWNFAGTVLGVLDSTHVLVQPPWVPGVTLGGDKGFVPVTGTVTLTKWDVNKAQALNSGSGFTVNLPAAAKCSPGDTIAFVNINAASGTPTVSPAGSDKINGGSSYTGSTTQYSQFTLRTDGVSNWYTVTPNASGTLGATTFTGAITVSGAVTVTDAAAGALAVGPNGATNPCLSVDGSVSSAATGINVQGQAAGSGVILSTISSGSNEDLLVQPKGTGAVKITSSGAAGLTVGPNGATNPTFQVVCNVSSEATGLKVTGAAAASGLALAVISSGSAENLTIDAKGSGTITFGSVSTGNILFSQGALVQGGTGGIGYGTGVGGTVTQGTSRTTGVTLNKLTGAITLVSAAGSATAFTFTVTNSTVVATDTVVASVKSSTDTYSVVVTAVAAGSFKLTVTDLTGTTTEQPVINFAVLKGVAS